MIYLGVVTLAVLGAVLGDGHNSILSLPGPDNTANYVKLVDPFQEDLSSLTMCVWLQNAYGDSGRYFLSYAVSGSDNELIFGDQEGFQGVWRGSKYLSGAAPKENVWSHVCWVWVGESGDTTLQVDGEVVAQDNLKPGTVVRAGGVLILGQEQDSVGGGFSARQSWLGRMYDMNIWDRALNETELHFLYSVDFCGFGSASLDPLLSWSDILDSELMGAANVLTGPCDYSAEEVASHGKVLRFPAASTSNFLQFTPALADEFTEFAVCTWFFKTYSDTGRYFFSYANSQGGDNSIILGEHSSGLGFWVNGQNLLSGVNVDKFTWCHLCFTWRSDSGAQIYLDGEMIAEDADLAAGKTKYGGGSLNIGQEQDSIGGRYDAGQAFAGSLYNLNVYSESLSADQVSELYADGTFCEKSGSATGGPTKYVSWSELYDVIPDGDVVFEDGEAAWRHGAPNCGAEDKGAEAHNTACWEEEEGVKYLGDSTGYITGDVEVAKAACFATDRCVGLTCQDLDNPQKLKCELKSAIRKPKPAKSKTSFKYNC